MSLTINYGAVYCQHRPIVVSMRVTWHLISVLFLVLSTFLSRAWLIMCVFFLCRVLQTTNEDGVRVALNMPQDRSHVDSWPWLCAHVCFMWRPIRPTLLSTSWQQMNALGRSLIESTVRRKTVPTIPITSCTKEEQKQNPRLTASLWSLKVVTVKLLRGNGISYQHYACLCCRFSLVILVKGSENSTENSILESKSLFTIEVSLYSR